MHSACFNDNNQKEITMKSHYAKLLATLIFVSTTSLGLSACKDDGPIEDAGEAVDEAVQDAGRAVEDATD